LGGYQREPKIEYTAAAHLRGATVLTSLARLMAKLRVGIDIIEVDEVAESLGCFGDGYLHRVFSDAELDSADDVSPKDVAARFAAKEAAMKAMGDLDEPLDWRSIEVISTPEGRQLRLTGRAAESAYELGVRRWSISTSVTERYALAVVLAAGES